MLARLLGETGELLAETPLRYAGESSTYQGNLEVPPLPGRALLEVLAMDPPNANFGQISTPVTIRD